MYANNYSIIIEIVTVAILFAFMRRGMKKGLVMLASGLISLVAGIFGARIIASGFYKTLANALFTNNVRQQITGVIQDIAYPQVGATAQQWLDFGSQTANKIIEMTNIPQFAVSFLRSLTNSAISTVSEFINAAGTVIAERISYVFIFAFSFFVIEGIMFFAIRIIDIIAKLPLIHGLNKITGALVGTLTGAILLMLVYWAASTFIPAMTYSGAIFSNEVINKTVFAKGIVTAYKSLLPIPYSKIAKDLLKFAMGGM